MKTVKEILEEAYLFLTERNTKEEHEKLAVPAMEFFKEKQINDPIEMGVFAGYLECAYANYPVWDNLQKQYDIKCNEKRQADQEIERLTRIIVDNGLGDKLEFEE